MCKPTSCMEIDCVHLVIGGKGKGKGDTHFYLCELGYEDYCEEPQFDIDEDIWKDMGK